MLRMSRVSVGLQAVLFALVFVIGAASTEVQAQGLVSMQKLSAPLANALVGEAVANCAQKGYTVTAVIVDLDGVRQALLRGNGAPIHTLDNAFYKAYSSPSLTLARKEDSTKAVADRQATNPPSTVPSTPLANVTYAGGGVTIIAGGKAIGGIGVSGAPGGQFDEEGARAAIAKIQYRMKERVAPGRMETARPALIAYDVCRRALTPADPARRAAMKPVLDAWVTLIGACRARGMPIVYTTPVSRADGADVVLLPTDLSVETGVPSLTNCVEGSPDAGFPDEVAPRPEDYVYPKRRPSAFYGPGVAELLRTLRRTALVIGGGATNRGVETSVREAFSM